MAIVDVGALRNYLQATNFPEAEKQTLFEQFPILNARFTYPDGSQLDDVRLFFQREKHFKVLGVLHSRAKPADIRTESETTAFKLKQVKNALGYEDADTRFHTRVRNFLKLSNVDSLKTLQNSPPALFAHWWRFDLFSELAVSSSSHYFALNDMDTSILPKKDPNLLSFLVARAGKAAPGSALSAFAIFAKDPLYPLGEKLADPEVRLKFYRAMNESTVFLSWFTLENRGSKPITNVGITIDTSGQDFLGLLEQPLEYYGLRKEDQAGTAIRIKSALLSPGDRNYKMIVALSKNTLLGRDAVSLDQRDLVLDVAEYYIYIFTIPLLFVLMHRREIALDALAEARKDLCR